MAISIRHWPFASNPMSWYRISFLPCVHTFVRYEIYPNLCLCPDPIVRWPLSSSPMRLYTLSARVPLRAPSERSLWSLVDWKFQFRATIELMVPGFSCAAVHNMISIFQHNTSVCSSSYCVCPTLLGIAPMHSPLVPKCILFPDNCQRCAWAVNNYHQSILIVRFLNRAQHPMIRYIRPLWYPIYAAPLFL